ncbi:SPOR domain-containing protein [Pantoea sp. Tr-811]|uniref:SPOR domain-containing protein n=1 Tax=unclassified Pantoea TaxID=2630326 RepID=UPI001422F060|nr:MULTISPECIES: SPOR domain-containing protein [unclassified Pantoea]NIE73767.1 SPOR domain-containing protein [Pantoea sp. Ap-967]NIF26857.1 SPOR domain-containing protein [Pantoea sp. Tr-811]
MAVLDKGMKQRMVGALVLVALAVIFLPMLFTREDEMRQVRVDAPQAPAMPSLPEVKVEPVAVPEPQPLPEQAEPPQVSQSPQQAQPQQPPVVVNESTRPVTAPSQPITPSPQTQVQAKPQTPVPVPKAAAPAPSKIDVNGLPVSWSIQLASLSNRAGAESLQKTLRSQGYNAYIRSAGGMNRVYVGPLIERAEADKLKDAINRQHKLNGFVTRFQPEKG